ncbi:DNA polymerase IV [Paenibacillus thailandensis]|uniref:DNA polymerase IV n=1 Tax=Paenibacillus thailandensis TaxID=393250 RepID=A0ABW5QZX8_9BACL
MKQETKGGRVILHLDMNAFYCSVHEAEEPGKYKNKPTAVGGSVEQRKGILVTCSYAARAKGVRTGMTIREALRLCPELIMIKPDFRLYRKYSERFMAIARQYTPLVQAVSIDECYLDITGSGLFGTPIQIAETIQKRIQTECSLPCSVGIGPNKLLAKMASDMKKPNGLTILRIRDMPALMWDKPCDTLFGVGRKTAEKLRRLNITTIGQLAAADQSFLVRHFGVYGEWLKLAANGIDHSPVDPEDGPSKSIGHTTTLPADVTGREEAARILLELSDRAGRRLRAQRLIAGTVQITLRRPDMTTITRSRTLPSPIRHTADIYKEALNLLDRHWREGDPIRLLGVTLQSLTEEAETAVQLDLFEYEKQPRKDALADVMDKLRNKFGEHAVRSASMASSTRTPKASEDVNE